MQALAALLVLALDAGSAQHRPQDLRLSASSLTADLAALPPPGGLEAMADPRAEVST